MMDNNLQQGGRGMNKVLDFGREAKNFLRESKAELKKVSWPTRKQVWYSTLVVVLLTAVLAAYLGAVDFVLTAVLRTFIG
jgi:preprotein translocase subunit SecE